MSGDVRLHRYRDTRSSDSPFHSQPPHPAAQPPGALTSKVAGPGSPNSSLPPSLELSPPVWLGKETKRRQSLTSAREATAALRKKPPQSGTSGVSPIAGLHAAALAQRSRMAPGTGRPPGVRARRSGNFSCAAAREPAPALLSVPAVLSGQSSHCSDLLEARATL
ncbi:hypothetical protein TREES_T100009176 [Tupaia chinensis]|uniref:Uncharacterized protein n=1 Tax=Tupaia chinensis TaxID=246437 RepID=L9KG52_TUPCH|nr:hypothetical protein TREES_T100009176 [Tupaia chinensis]